MRQRSPRLVAASLTVLAAFNGAAMAQEETDTGATTAEDQEEDSVRKLDEVMVTSVKREQSLQDVPVAVTAFTADLRQELALDSLGDFARFTPGLAFSAGDDRVFIRGVGRQTNTNGSDPGVATYSDGLYDASTRAVSKSDFFVERVEVLRGPQGTLYGRNSIGGAINVISKRPTDTFTSEARVELANYDTVTAETAISGPITDRVRAKLGLSYANQDEGYFENVAGGPNEAGDLKTSYIEFQLEADLADNFSVWIKADTTEGDFLNRTTNLAGPYDVSPFPTGYLTPGPAFGYSQANLFLAGDATSNPGENDIRKFNVNTTTHSTLDDDFGFSAIATWNLENVDIKYLGGYRTYFYNSFRDDDDTNVLSYSFPLDPANPAAGEVFTGGPNCAFLQVAVGPICTPATVFPQRTFDYTEDKEFWSHELTAQSSGDSDLWWILGAYLYEENFLQESHFGNAAQPEILAPVGGPANPSGDYVTAISDINTKSYALFAQADYSITDTLTLTGGLRYSMDEKEGSEFLRVIAYGVIPGFTLGGSGNLTPALDLTSSTVSNSDAPGVASLVTIDPVTGLAQRDLSGEWDAVSGTAAIQWQPDASSNYFLRYSRGYKSGGFNAGGISQFPQTNEELLDAIEIGAKKSFSETFQLNATAYLYAYDGLQVPLDVQENGIQLTRFFNLEDSRAQGIELEANWTPTDALRVLATYAYNDSEVREACCFVDVADPLAQQPGAQPSGPASGGNQPQDLKGEMLPRTIPNKFGLNVSYDIPLGANGDVTLSGNYSWLDETYHGVFNRSYTQTPAYDQVDLVGLWRNPDDTLQVLAYVKNVFDEQGFDGATGTFRVQPAGVSQTLYLTPPRTYGVQLQMKF
ncbi:TonB-dependent receptor [Henriciella sp.]|uniref:TonB-dependent receptor n=1 Tax=Henriciella sp. TaxID=1968823 RepID=UPI00262812D7|nr:TonB-dependent receptor [Henriciella sp.]